MTKAAKIGCAAGLAVFALTALLGLTVTVVQKAAGVTFFVNGTVNSYRISPFLVLWLGVLGGAVLALFLCIGKKAKKPLRILTGAVIAFSLFAVVLSLAGLTADRTFYTESSPDGEREIVICSYQFLIVCGGDVYERVDPLFIRRLANEEKKHVEWFYEDYSVEWHDGYVIVDGYTYPLTEE